MLKQFLTQFDLKSFIFFFSLLSSQAYNIHRVEKADAKILELVVKIQNHDRIFLEQKEKLDAILTELKSLSSVKQLPFVESQASSPLTCVNPDWSSYLISFISNPTLWWVVFGTCAILGGVCVVANLAPSSYVGTGVYKVAKIGDNLLANFVDSMFIGKKTGQSQVFFDSTTGNSFLVAYEKNSGEVQNIFIKTPAENQYIKVSNYFQDLYNFLAKFSKKAAHDASTQTDFSGVLNSNNTLLGETLKAVENVSETVPFSVVENVLPIMPAVELCTEAIKGSF